MQPFRRNAANEGMLPLAKHLHSVVCKMFKEAIQGEARAVYVDLFEFAIKICVFVYKFQTQPIGVFQEFAYFNRFQAAGLLIIIPPPCA